MSIQKAGPLQTIEYMTLSEGPSSGWILGLKLYMQKYHFQLPELRLKCVAIFHNTVKEYQSQVNVISKSEELVQAHSASRSARNVQPDNQWTCGLILVALFNLFVDTMHRFVFCSCL